MTREDQHTDLKSLRIVKGKSADWAALAQTALNRRWFFGTVSQIHSCELAKSLFSNDFFIRSLVPNEPNLSQSMLDRRHGPYRFSKNTLKHFTTCRTRLQTVPLDLARAAIRARGLAFRTCTPLVVVVDRQLAHLSIQKSDLPTQTTRNPIYDLSFR